MAVQVRTRRLANPGRRRAKARNPKKRMSLKQKLHFGTARQRAAARAGLSRKRKNPSYAKSIKAQNKRESKATRRKYASKIAASNRRWANPKRKRRKNIGEIVSISLAGLNPGRKRRKNTGMARHRKLKSTASAKASRRAYRRAKARRGNPGVTRRRRNYGHSRRRSYRRRSNPGMSMRRRKNPVYRLRRINRGRRRNAGIGGLTSGTIGKALGVIGGMLGSKYLTQLALGGNNTGVMGYAGNLVASLALGWGAGKVTKNSDFGVMVTVGGIGALILRILSDNTSIGQYVNLSLAGVGKGGDIGLGIIQDSSFPVPQVAQPGSMTNFIVPRATRNYVSAQTTQMVAAGSTGSSGMGRMKGRAGRRAIM